MVRVKRTKPPLEQLVCVDGPAHGRAVKVAPGSEVFYVPVAPPVDVLADPEADVPGPAVYRRARFALGPDSYMDFFMTGDFEQLGTKRVLDALREAGVIPV